MKRFLAILILPILTVSCGTKYEPHALPAVKIPKAKVIEEAHAITRTVGDVEGSNGRIKGQLGIAVLRGNDAIASAKELESELARLASKEAITRAELATAEKMWGKSFRDVQVMQAEVVRANDMVTEQAGIIYALRQDSTRLMVEAANASRSLDISIQQSESYARHANEAQAANVQLLTDKAVLARENGKLKAWRLWLGGIVLLYLVVRIGKLFTPALRWIP